MYDLNGKILYNGDFIDGKFEGIGTQYFPDGKIQYKGNFKKNIYNGYGSLFIKNDNLIMHKGLFLESKMITKLGKYNYNTEIISCNLCMEDFNSIDLFPICGSKDCAECCISCIKKYLNKIKCTNGSKIFMNSILCPFCKNEILKSIINNYHNKLYAFIPKIKQLKDKEIIGICYECKKDNIYKPEGECGEQINRAKYICEDCDGKKLMEKMNLKQCPKCGIKVQKISGCHYVVCKCTVAWCYHCACIYAPNEHHVVRCKECGKE
jgi:hypothetical protein